jgi:hypothetical protein
MATFRIETTAAEADTDNARHRWSVQLTPEDLGKLAAGIPIDVTATLPNVPVRELALTVKP